MAREMGGRVDGGACPTAEDHRSQRRLQVATAQAMGVRAPQAYPGAERVICRHETLAVGERCPVCGRGRLYRVAPGVEIRIDGNALLSAIRYELEKLRCSACGQVFTAPLPAEAGQRNTAPGHGRCWCWGATTWVCHSTAWKAIKRCWACRCPMRRSGIRSNGWPTVAIRCLSISRPWRRKGR